MSGTEKSGRIGSFQALRALAFLGIFLYHTHFLISWPFLGVSIFFIMSGFLMTHRYKYRELRPSFRANAEFSLKEIKRLYPLHIITMIFAMVVYFAIMLFEGVTIKAVIAYVGKVVLNIFLIQSWFPYSSVCASLNGVAWYLSVMAFLYFFFPWLISFIKKTKLSTLVVVAIISWCLEFILSFFLVKMLGNDSKVYMWFAYMFPIVRLEDFFVGCILERFYSETDARYLGVVKSSVLEFAIAVLSCLVFFWGRTSHDSTLEQVLNNWTLLHMPLAAMWVFAFANNRGVLTKMSTNKVLISLGNISQYAFLIHFVISLYIYYLFDYLGINTTRLQQIILVGMEFVVTVVLSVIYKSFSEKNSRNLKSH